MSKYGKVLTVSFVMLVRRIGRVGRQDAVTSSSSSPTACAGRKSSRARIRYCSAQTAAAGTCRRAQTQVLA